MTRDANARLQAIVAELATDEELRLLGFIAVHDEDNPVPINVLGEKAKIWFPDEMLVNIAMAIVAKAQADNRAEREGGDEKDE